MKTALNNKVVEIKDIRCRCVKYGNGVVADCFTGWKVLQGAED